MKILITANRVRSILQGLHTEKEAAETLRLHRIRYSYSTEGGYMHIRIPARSGILRVYRTASRTAPLIIAPAVPAPYQYTRPSWPSWEVDA